MNLYFFKKINIYKIFKNLFLNKNTINFDKYLKNRNNNKKNFILFKKYFQHLYFTKRINRRMFGYKMKLRHSRGLFFLKKRFMPTMRHFIYKNFKKKNFYSFLNKYNNKNFYSRKFLGFQNLIYNQSFKKKFIFKRRKIKKNFLKGHRFYKKLNTFYYIPDTDRTREQVYKRFKKSVVKKFKKKKFRKSLRHLTGLRFNLSLYNARTRYKNRIKALALKKKSTPLYHFFKGKFNDYQKSTKLKINKKHYELPFFVLKKHKFNVKKKKKPYLKRED
jgi:hypothetical protein